MNEINLQIRKLILATTQLLFVFSTLHSSCKISNRMSLDSNGDTPGYRKDATLGKVLLDPGSRGRGVCGVQSLWDPQILC